MRSADVIRLIAESGLRVFGMKELKEISQVAGISASYIPKLIQNLIKHGILRQCMRGIYTLDNSLLSGPPLSNFEIAHYIVQPSAICCWSAFSLHHLTDQVIRSVYMVSPLHQTMRHTSKYIYQIDHTPIIIIRVHPDNFFGIEKKWLTEIPIYVTDLERTLIDGLVRPQYCGGFFEVIHAFKEAEGRIDGQKLVQYAKRYSLAAVKRLGWVLERLTLYPDLQEDLLSVQTKAIHKLDVTKPLSGPLNKKWKIQENL